VSTEEFLSRSPEETIAIGHRLVSLLEPGQMVVLRGDLGAGKTTLVKGIAEGFHSALRENVTSPTFTLVHEYRGARVTLFHIDLYRIDTERELMTLGIDDLRSQPGNVVIVEWGEKFDWIVQESNAEVRIQRMGENERRIVFAPKGGETRNRRPWAPLKWQ